MEKTYFKYEEFACKCCGNVSMDGDLIDKLNDARRDYGQPIIITSGYRCEKHNKKIGGSPTSSHLTGRAVDIQCLISNDRFHLLQSLFYAGFSRIGVAKTFIHVDIDELDKPFNMLWTY